MYRIDNASSVAVKPAYAAAGATPNQYFDNGTVWDHDFANHLQEELANACGIKGVALSKASDNQLATALNGVQAISSAASGTLLDSSAHTRALSAVTACQVSGNNSKVSASAGTAGTASYIIASGAQSHIVASLAADVGGADMTLSGGRSFIAACYVDSAAMTVGAGNQSAAIACASAVNTFTVSGSQSAAIASSSTTNGALVISGDNSTAISSEYPNIVGDYSAAIASSSASVSAGKFRSALIGCSGGSIGHNNCVALASSLPGASPGNYTVYGGDSNANTWTIYSVTGLGEFNSLQVKAMPALDPADGSNTLWNNGGVITMGT